MGPEEGTDLVIRGISTLLTCDPGREVDGIEVPVEDGTVVVRHGRIVYAGPGDGSPVIPDGMATVIDARGHTVIPGFVDSHTHLAFSGDRAFELGAKLQGRSYLEILKAGGGILSSVRALRGTTLPSLLEQMRSRLDRMARYGTTTVEVKSGYGLDLETELRSLEAVSILDGTSRQDIHGTFLGAHAVPPEWSSDEDYADHICSSMLPAVAEQGIARFCDVFCETGVFSSEVTERILMAASGHGLVPKLHIDELESIGGADVAIKVGAISVEHLLRTGPEDARSLARSGIIGVLLPGTPFALMKDDYAPARMFMDEGLDVALATDCNPNCYTESMPFIISLACYRMGMTPFEAIRGATINGARALGLQDEVGSLTPGKRADIVILDGPTLDHLPYRFGINPVRMTIKDGTILGSGEP